MPALGAGWCPGAAARGLLQPPPGAWVKELLLRLSWLSGLSDGGGGSGEAASRTPGKLWLRQPASPSPTPFLACLSFQYWGGSCCVF